LPKKRTDEKRDSLRADAETLRGNAPRHPGLPPADLLHELRVHQIELEMQNEELRRSQVALEAARDRYQDLFDFAPVGYLTVGTSGLIEEVNLTGASLLGAERNDLIGRPFVAFVAPDDRSRWHVVVRSLVEQDDKQTCDVKLRRRDGSVFGGALDCARAKGAAGPAIRFAFTDNSERERAERVLRQGEARLRAAIEASPVPSALNDAQGNITWLNRAFLQTVGYTRKDIPTLADWWPRAYPDPNYRQWVADSWQERLEKARRTGEPFAPMELQIECKDGVLRDFLVSAAGLEGDFAGTHVVTLHDITERKRAEETLRRSEEKFRAVADYTYDWERWDAPGGAILYCSPSCERITGHSADAFMADPGLLQRLIHPEDLARWQAHYAAVHSESTTPESLAGPVREVDFRILRPDGEVRWVGHVCQLIRDPEGHDLGRRISNRDITDRKRAEAERNDMQAQLALTSRLAALGTLVAGVAHEINNPLAAALSDQELARGALRQVRDRLRGSGPLDREAEVHHLDAVVEELDEARDACRRIERIVKDLKTFGRHDQTRTRVRLIDIVDLAMRWLPVTIGQTATITVENGGAPDVTASPGQIEQVVVNLVTNAAHATPEGQRGAIVVRLGPGRPGMARLDVIDHGKGIEPAIMARIFDPFFTTREVGKGTGLGLSICHAIVTNHGGTLTATSEVGKGSTFRIDLPAG
jgi:PAS domain S-box-containing protein